MIRKKLVFQIENIMKRNQGTFLFYFFLFQGGWPGKKQARLVKDLTVVITNMLFSECERKH